MKEYLLNKYKEHHATMKRAVEFYNDRDTYREFGACDVLAAALTETGLMSDNEFRIFRNSL